MDVNSGELAGTRLYLCGEVQDEASGKCAESYWDSEVQRGQETFDVDTEAVGARGNQRATGLSGEGGDQRLVFAGAIGKSGEVFDDGGLKLFFEKRDEFAADAGAGARRIAIRGVFSPLLFP